MIKNYSHVIQRDDVVETVLSNRVTRIQSSAKKIEPGRSTCLDDLEKMKIEGEACVFKKTLSHWEHDDGWLELKLALESD